MSKDQEFASLTEYIKELNTVKSEVLQIISEKNEKALLNAAKYYPQKINQLLTQRNIESASGCFPFLIMGFINQKKQNLDLLDLNTEKDDIDKLWEVIRRIDQELEDFKESGKNPPGED